MIKNSGSADLAEARFVCVKIFEIMQFNEANKSVWNKPFKCMVERTIEM